MKRDLSKIEDILTDPIDSYGTQGEFYFNNNGFRGQDKDPSIMEYNSPPSTQPSLWLQWVIDDAQFKNDGKTLQWDQGEKFYYYVEWLEYLIEKIFKPNDVIVSGSVNWRGEEWDDNGTISIDNNNITIT